MVVDALNAFLNPRRLRDYPKLALIVMSAVVIFNLLAHDGWLGGLGQMIGHDFIAEYTGALAYLADPTQLYDYSVGWEIQQELVAPTELPGFAPFLNPPYSVSIGATLMKLPVAMALWSLGMLAAVVAASVFAARYLVPPPPFSSAQLPASRISVLVFSSFAFVEGFAVGQNHALTLLIVVAVCAAMLKGKPVWSGLLAGLLIYKPHLAIGLVLVWLTWGDLRALLSSAASATLWAGTYLLVHGLDPFITYLKLGGRLMALSYEGNPGYIMTTLYGLLTSLLPATSMHWLKIIAAVV